MPKALKGGNLSLKGFGRFADVTAMDADLWADLTLQTLRANGRIDSSIEVADRLAFTTLSPVLTPVMARACLCAGRVPPGCKPT